MCRHCITRRYAGKVKLQTPKVHKKEDKRKKYGRAKQRDQFNKKIVNGAEVCNRTQSTSIDYPLHRKNPRFIANSIEPVTSYKKWIQVLAGPTNETPDIKHDKIYHKSITTASGHRFRIRTHTQKNKGSTGKSIQLERNQASRIKVAAALYGEDYELEL